MKTIKDILSDGFWIMPSTPQFIENGEIPYITSKNIKIGNIDFSNVEYISKEDFEEISKNRPIKVNDMLISMIGTLGNIAIVKETDGSFYGQNMYLLRLNSDVIDRDYFYHFFNSDVVKRHIESRKNKSTQGYLKANHIEEIAIPVPSMEEQKEIASHFEAINSLIDARKEQLEKLDLLVKSRFIELFGEVEINVKGFPMKRMDECCKFIGGAQPDKSHFEYEKTDDNIRLIQIRDYKSDRFITYIPKSLARKTCTASDIMIGRYGPPIFQILGGIEGAYNVALMKAVPTAEFNTEYFRYFLKSEKLLHYLESFSQRTAGQDGIQIDKLNAYPCFVPPMELQIQFAAFVEQTDKSKLAVQQSLEKLETLKKALMQKYFG